MQSLTRAELLTLLACAKRTSTRGWLAILVAFWHGARASEVIGISRDQISDGFLTLARLKGSLTTVQPLISHAEPLLNEREALLAYAEKLPQKAKLFPFTRRTFYNIVSRAAKDAGLPAHQRHPHMLKHTIAVLSLNGGAKIHEVRQRLGHKSLASTGRYLEVTDKDAALGVERALRG